MGRSRKLKLTNWSLANDRLLLHFEGNKSKLADHAKISRTTVTEFFGEKTLGEAKFRDICLALRLNWQEVSSIEEGDRSPSSQTSEEEEFERLVAEVRSRCCQKILHQHSTIQLLNQTEIGVDQLYVDVWLLNRSPRTFQVSDSTLLKSFDLRNDRLGLGDRVRRNEGMLIANEKPRLLILGKPGAGKTTFLKHLAVDCCNGKFQPILIPVLIELRRIQSTNWNLVNAISEEIQLDSPQTLELLRQGRLLILMDGLDEAPTKRFRQAIQSQIIEITKEPQNQGNRFILTCRTQIIEVPPKGFASVEVADFNKEQVKRFVENWFQASDFSKEEIAQKLELFLNKTEDNPALKELTATPILLSLMCLILQDEGDLPTQTPLLYYKGIRLLLETWNERKEIHEWEVGSLVYRKLNTEQKEALLIEIAAKKFENPENFVLFKLRDLSEQIADFLKLSSREEAKNVLKAIEAQHGLLVERADELWSFSHLTFQEYFTAQWLTQLQKDVGLVDKITDKRWQEVVKLAIRSQQPADRLLRLIKQAIDHSILDNIELNNFLAWISEKVKIVRVSYKPSAIRAFYFDLAITLMQDQNPQLDLAFYLDENLTHDFDFELPLDSDLDLDFNLSLALSYAKICNTTHDPEVVIDTTRDCALALEQAIERTSNFDLATQLQRLKTQLPEDYFFDDVENSKQWWMASGDAWAETLRKAMVKHRNLGQDWKFTESQLDALIRFHEANKFIAELLLEPGAASGKARKEIVNSLILPITTLK